MHSESLQAHPHQANRDWHAPSAHQSVWHQRASSVVRKCQTYAQGITVEVILCKYSRHHEIHASCGFRFTPRWVLGFCIQMGAWPRGWRVGVQNVPKYPSDNRSFQRMKAPQCQTEEGTTFQTGRHCLCGGGGARCVCMEGEAVLFTW